MAEKNTCNVNDGQKIYNVIHVAINVYVLT